MRSARLVALAISLCAQSCNFKCHSRSIFHGRALALKKLTALNFALISKLWKECLLHRFQPFQAFSYAVIWLILVRWKYLFIVWKLRIQISYLTRNTWLWTLNFAIIYAYNCTYSYLPNRRVYTPCPKRSNREAIA